MHNTCCAETSSEKKGCACCPGKFSHIGRILFALPFLVFGAFHFLNGQAMAGMLVGWPAALFLVYVSGAGLLLGALAILFNRYAHLAALLLAAELGLFILTLHLPGMLSGGPGVQMSMASALKDLALAGGALVLASHMGNRGFGSEGGK